MFGIDSSVATAIYFAITIPIILIIYSLKVDSDRKKEKAQLLRRIRKTKLIAITNGSGSRSHTTTHGAISRAAIGTLVAGPVGGIIGASTARTHTYTTNDPPKYMFIVYYKNGKHKRDTVTEKDWKFEIYMDHIDLGDE